MFFGLFVCLFFNNWWPVYLKGWCKHLQWGLPPQLPAQDSWTWSASQSQDCAGQWVTRGSENNPKFLEPFPQGGFLVVTLTVLVGIRAGPFSWRFFSFVPLIKSAHTFSKDFPLRLVRVILSLWIATSRFIGVFLVYLKAMAVAPLPDWLVPREEWTVGSQELVGKAEPSSSSKKPCC